MAASATRVSFYVLAAGDPAARLDYACRLVEKVYRLNQRVHVHAGSSEYARTIDERLWTFRQGSFVPHEMLRAGSAPEAPVTIGCGDAAPAGDVLINLADTVPAFFSAFERVAEIIDGSEQCRLAGRARHRFYRQQELSPETFEVA